MVKQEASSARSFLSCLEQVLPACLNEVLFVVLEIIFSNMHIKVPTYQPVGTRYDR